MDFSLVTKMTILQMMKKQGESYNRNPWNFEDIYSRVELGGSSSLLLFIWHLNKLDIKGTDNKQWRGVFIKNCRLEVEKQYL